MLPDSLNSTYKWYKNDTSIFIEWILENAQKCGYRKEEKEEDPTTTKPTTRLKGKARKLAQEAQKSVDTSSPSPEQNNNVVSTRELLSMAKAIATSKRSVTLPRYIIQAGIRAVSARRKCSAYFKVVAAVGDVEQSTINSKHEYFTTTIESVLQTLEPLFPTPASPANKETSSTFETLQNRFAQLEVEDTMEEPYSEAGVKTESTDEKFYQLKPTEEHEIQEESQFAIFCLLDELQTLRSFVNGLWKNYKNGVADLITTATTTNTAFVLATRAQNQTLALFPDSESFGDVLPTILAMIREKVNTKTDESSKSINGCSETYEEWYFIPAYNVLKDFCKDELVPPNATFAAQDLYTRPSDRSKLDPEEKNKDFRDLLWHLLLDICFLTRTNTSFIPMDEFIKGIQGMVVNKTIPVWLPFAATVVLDIHFIMGEKLNTAFNDMLIVVDHFRDAMEYNDKFPDGLARPSGGAWAQADEYKKSTVGTAMWLVEKDQIAQKKKNCSTESGTPLPEEEEFLFVKSHPVLCGLVAFHTILTLGDIGELYCFKYFTIPYMAHLYNALKHVGPPVKSWPLLEEVISLHTPEAIFGGSIPDSLGSCKNRFCLIIGISASMFAPVKRRRRDQRAHPKVTMSKSGNIMLKNRKPPSELMALLFEGLRNKTPMTTAINKAEKLLNEQARNIEQLARDPTTQPVRHNDRSRNKSMTTVQFLQAFQASLLQEIPKTQFDYFELNRQGITFCNKLWADLGDDCAGLFNYELEETRRHYLPLDIMVVLSSELLDRARNVFSEFMDEINKKSV